MKMTFAGFLLFIALLFNILSCKKTENNEIEPEKEELTDGIRIAWDYATLKRVAPLPGRSPGYYGYARMIQLHDGRLACVYETSEGNVELTVSTDLGKSWKWPKTIFQTVNNITMAVPSILELNDQSLLVACNPRPREPYTDDRKFGIKIRKSTDGGATWMTEQTVYEAQSTFNDGCWEPAMVQLPGGEVQLYFSNEGIYTRSNEQDISLLRSFDLGETWTTEPEVAGFRKTRRDGMPVPLLLADRGELLISIEDNKAGEFKPSIYREKISDNWSGGFIGADDPRRTYHPLSDPLPLDIYAGGPYIAMLHSGEVLLSYQTTLDRNKVWNYSSMAVEIGDSEGRLYSRRSVPFSMPVSKWGLWNSLAVIGDNVPVAITSTNAFSANSTEVWMITGRIIPEFSIPTATPLVDGSAGDECWSADWPYFVGAYTAANLSASLAADGDYLYMVASLNHPEGIVPGDGMVLQLDRERKGYTAPQKGIFTFHFTENGSISLMEGHEKQWVSVEDTSPLKMKTSLTDNTCYFEVAIPWNFLKISPSANAKMGVNFILKTKDAEGKTYEETISSNDSEKPFTWCPVFLTVF